MYRLVFEDARMEKKNFIACCEIILAKRKRRE
jgi:hypothetical protein